MKLPRNVKLGTQVWEIKATKRKDVPDLNEGWYGYTQDKEGVIVIDVDMPEKLQRVTLLHELLHAIRFTFGGSYKPDKKTEYEDWEHYWIGLYEEPLLMLLRDNPELVEYLLGE